MPGPVFTGAKGKIPIISLIGGSRGEKAYALGEHYELMSELMDSTVGQADGVLGAAVPPQDQQESQDGAAIEAEAVDEEGFVAPETAEATNLSAGEAAESKSFILDQMPGLLDQGSTLAGELTGNFYEVGTGLSAAFPHAAGLSAGAIDNAMGWVTSDLVPGGFYDRGTMLDRLGGVINRHLYGTGRDVMGYNLKKNKQRWRRYASATACPFCRVMAIRGSVYWSEETAQAHFHNNCRCIAVPDSFSDDMPSYYDKWEDQYRQARSQVGGDFDDILNYMRRDDYAAHSKGLIPHQVAVANVSKSGASRFSNLLAGKGISTPKGVESYLDLPVPEAGKTLPESTVEVRKAPSKTSLQAAEASFAGSGDGGGTFVGPKLESFDASQGGFSVGGKAPTMVVKADTPEELAKAIEQFKSEHPGAIGTWRYQGQWYIDSIDVITDKAKAIESAHNAGELAIFDLGKGEEVDTFYHLGDDFVPVKAAIDKAATPEQLSDVFRGRHPEVSSDIQGTELLNEQGLENMKHAIHGLDDAMDRDIEGTVQYVKIGNTTELGDGAVAVTHHFLEPKDGIERGHPGEASIEFNSKYLNGDNEIKAKEGFHPKGYNEDPFYYSAVHEYGHVLDAAGRITPNRWDLVDGALKDKYFELHPDISAYRDKAIADVKRDGMVSLLQNDAYIDGRARELAWKDGGQQWLHDNMSEYSFSPSGLSGIQENEALAEAYMDVVINGEKATDTSKALYDVLTNQAKGIDNPNIKAEFVRKNALDQSNAQADALKEYAKEWGGVDNAVKRIKLYHNMGGDTAKAVEKYLPDPSDINSIDKLAETVKAETPEVTSQLLSTGRRSANPSIPQKLKFLNEYVHNLGYKKGSSTKFLEDHEPIGTHTTPGVKHKDQGSLEDRLGETQAGMVKNITDVLSRASKTEIDDGLNWYDRANALAKYMSENGGVDIHNAAGAIAVMSQNTSWDMNALGAVGLARGDIAKTPGYGLNKNWEQAQKMWNETGDPFKNFNPDPEKSRKLKSFYWNILGDKNEVTVDRWAARVAGVDDANLPKVGAYKAIADAYRKVGEKYGLDPRDVQAITWIRLRNEEAPVGSLIEKNVPVLDPKQLKKLKPGELEQIKKDSLTTAPLPPKARNPFDVSDTYKDRLQGMKDEIAAKKAAHTDEVVAAIKVAPEHVKKVQEAIHRGENPYEAYKKIQETPTPAPVAKPEAPQYKTSDDVRKAYKDLIIDGKDKDADDFAKKWFLDPKDPSTADPGIAATKALWTKKLNDATSYFDAKSAFKQLHPQISVVDNYATDAYGNQLLGRTIDTPTAKDAFKSLDKNLKKYPDNNMTKFMFSSGKDMGGYTYADTNGAGEVRLNMDWGTRKDFNEKFQRDYKNGFHYKAPTTKGVDAILTHEYGHVIDFSTAQNAPGYGTAGRTSPFASVGMIERIMKKDGVKLPTLPGGVQGPKQWAIENEYNRLTSEWGTKNHVSDYAKQSEQEAFAEAFQDVEMNGAAAQPGSKKMYADIMEQYKKAFEADNSGVVGDDLLNTLDSRPVDDVRLQNVSLESDKGVQRARWNDDAKAKAQEFLDNNRGGSVTDDPYSGGDLRDDAVAMVDRHKKDHENIQRTNHITKKQYVTIQNDAMSKYANRSEVAIHVPMEDLPNIIKDGHVKSQIETGTTASFNIDQERRVAHESVWFGDGEHAVTPAIYAVLRPKGSISDGAAGIYGNVTITLKDSVKSRTSATVGDSLDDDLTVSPVSLSGSGKEYNTAISPDIMDEAIGRSTITPEGDPMKLDVDKASDLLADNIQESAEVVDDARSVDYIEAQVHDGVTLDDIESVDIPDASTKESADLVKTLQSKGIKVTVNRTKTPQLAEPVIPKGEPKSVFEESTFGDIDPDLLARAKARGLKF